MVASTPIAVAGYDGSNGLVVGVPRATLSVAAAGVATVGCDASFGAGAGTGKVYALIFAAAPVAIGPGVGEVG